MPVFKKIAGIPLPKRVMGPARCRAPLQIDDEKCIELAPSDPIVLYGVLAIFTGIASIITFFIWLATYEYIPLLISIISLTITVFLLKRPGSLKPTKKIIFNRNTGEISFPKLFINKYFSLNWNDCEGRIIRGATNIGTPDDHLMLIDSHTYRMVMIDTSVIGVNTLLSYWSFLVLYMNKNGPLPNIPELQKYDNLAEDLGPTKNWDEKIASGEIFDPWKEWQIELKEHPELDVINESRERKLNEELKKESRH